MFDLKKEIQKMEPRERILSASLELFVERGYFNTNVPDISKCSNCSVGSIYHHFLNKEEIARDLYDLSLTNFRGSLAEAIKDCEDLESTICALVERFLIYSENNLQSAKYLWLARHSEFLTKNVKKPTVMGFDALGRKLAKIIKTSMKKGEIPSIKGEVIWSIIFGIPLSYLLDWLDGYTKTPPSQVTTPLSQACYSALKSLK